MEEDFYKFYFIYRNDEIEIQCKANEKMGEILKRFASKVGEVDNIKSLVFLLSGNIVKEDLTVKEIIGKNIFNLKKILVYSNAPIQKPDVIKKSNNIICPECKEDIRLKINDFKIYLYDCKNGHQINDIFLNEFEKHKILIKEKVTIMNFIFVLHANLIYVHYVIINTIKIIKSLSIKENIIFVMNIMILI